VGQATEAVLALGAEAPDAGGRRGTSDRQGGASGEQVPPPATRSGCWCNSKCPTARPAPSWLRLQATGTACAMRRCLRAPTVASCCRARARGARARAEFAELRHTAAWLGHRPAPLLVQPEASARPTWLCKPLGAQLRDRRLLPNRGSATVRPFRSAGHRPHQKPAAASLGPTFSGLVGPNGRHAPALVARCGGALTRARPRRQQRPFLGAEKGFDSLLLLARFRARLQVTVKEPWPVSFAARCASRAAGRSGSSRGWDGLCSRFRKLSRPRASPSSTGVRGDPPHAEIAPTPDDGRDMLNIPLPVAEPVASPGR